ncbi:MAG: DUF4251 domain-containing protein [Bacteroidales bacterium]
MNRLIVFLLLLMSVTLAAAQSRTASGVASQRMTREERKAARAMEEEKRAREVAALLNDTLFVLEADRLSGKDGMATVVNPGLNFIALSKGRMVIQTGSDLEFGPNGLGGTTITGRLTSFATETNKKGYTRIKGNFQGSTARNYRLDLSISPSGNAVGRITDIKGDYLEYRGRIKSVEDARVFEGVTVF